MEVVRTRGRSKTPNFTTHDKNIYHALGQAREAVKYRTSAWTATQECMFGDLAERRARHRANHYPNGETHLTGISFELRAEGWQMREIDSIRLCVTEDHPSVGTVGLRQCLYDTDRR
ncbi:hypothetical protein Efla_004032 [Eimeria flavescens]